MKIAITGHRPNKLNHDYKLESGLVQKIRTEIEKIIAEKQPNFLISGMALGIDTLFAKIAMDTNIPLIACIPFDGQEKVWPRESQRVYNSILDWENTTRIVVTPGRYDSWKMQKRNEFMVDMCNLLIAVWDGSNGGTKNCIDYAMKTGRETIIIDLNKIKQS